MVFNSSMGHKHKMNMNTALTRLIDEDYGLA